MTISSSSHRGGEGKTIDTAQTGAQGREGRPVHYLLSTNNHTSYGNF